MNDFGMNTDTSFSIHYTGLLTDIKQRIRYAQARTMLAANAELIRLYWEVGALIDTRQQKEGWGTSVICTINCPRKRAFLDATSSACWLSTVSIQPWHLCHRLWYKRKRQRAFVITI